MKSKLRFWDKGRKSQPVSTPSRTKEEVQKNYDDLCRQAGDIQFKIASLSALLQHVNMAMGKEVDKLTEFERQEAEKATKEQQAATASQPVDEAGELIPTPNEPVDDTIPEPAESPQ